jgi:hypothetical protein
MAIKPDPPGRVRALDPRTEWQDVKANQAAGRTGTLVVRVSVSMPELPPSRMDRIPFEVMPYTPAAWHDFETLLRWRYDSTALPADFARYREAPTELAEVLRTYREKLAEAGLQGAVHVASSKAEGEVRLDDMPAGEYLVFSEFRQRPRTGDSGPRLWAWLARVRVEPARTVDIVLDNATALCFWNMGWASTTTCRPASSSER